MNVAVWRRGVVGHGAGDQRRCPSPAQLHGDRAGCDASEKVALTGGADGHARAVGCGVCATTVGAVVSVAVVSKTTSTQ